MARLETTIYTARNTRQARRVREALESAGVEARVAEPPDPHGPEAGATGWSSGVRVLVAEGDALAARQIAAEFAQGRSTSPGAGDFGSAPAGTSAGGPDSSSLPDWWPTCPACGAARSTACPICGTAGTRFEAIDMGFSLIEGLDDVMGASGPSCGPGACGPEGCTPPASADPASARASAAEPPADEPSMAGPIPPNGADDEAGMAERMVICPTCDEPFRPEHPKRCEWCGHEFPDGVDMPLPDEADDADEFTGRVYVVIGLLLAIVIAALLYFSFAIY